LLYTILTLQADIQGMRNWRGKLREIRESLGLSRSDLARRSGVPVDTIRRWEDGNRSPRHASLTAVLAALDCPSAEANAILLDAGFAPQPTLFPADRFPNFWFTIDELPHAVEEVAWPEFVLNDHAEIITANAATQAVWRINFAWEKAHRTQAQMNVLSVASDHRFAERLVNWEEVIGALISAFKGRPQNPRDLDEPDPYFNAVLAEFAAGDRTFLERLIKTWESTPAREAKCRWMFPVVWRDDDFGEMRFIDVVNPASDPDALGFNDWIPVDAQTWKILEQVKARLS
jgi:transcriptional regulator with XRE-family HTH domain